MNRRGKGEGGRVFAYGIWSMLPVGTSFLLFLLFLLLFFFFGFPSSSAIFGDAIWTRWMGARCLEEKSVGAYKRGDVGEGVSNTLASLAACMH